MEEKIDNIEERLNEIEKIRIQLLKYVGIGEPVNSDVKYYMSLSEDQLKKMSPEDCVAASHTLSRTATFMQLTINKYMRIIKWATHNLDIMIAKVLENYGTKYDKIEYRRSMAINSSQVMMKFQKLIVDAELIVESVHFIPQYINKQADKLVELAKIKRNQQ